MNIDDFFMSTVCGDIARQRPELNARTGVQVRALPGVTFRTSLLDEGFPLLSLRRLPMSFVPEIMWFLSGQRDTSWLSGHTKIWNSFAEEDGTVTSAYGHRWRRHFGIDQLDVVLKKLGSDPSSRHGVVMMWDPATDLVVKQKNVPCPYTFTLNIIRGALHLHLVVRSNDMVLGFPTDVAGFALLQHILAQKLGVRPGILTHSISNAHVYEDQLGAVAEMEGRLSQMGQVRLDLPQDTYKRACKLDDSLVAELKASFIGYYPCPAIKGIPIAL